MVELNKIYNEDCLKTMVRMEDESVDLVVTSPPYDDLRNYNNSLKGFGPKEWEPIIKELFRIIKIGGVVVYIVADKTKNGSESGSSFKQTLFFMESGFNLHDTMIWKKFAGPLNHMRYEQEFEFMFVFSKNKIKTFNPIKIPCTYDNTKIKTNPNYDNGRIRNTNNWTAKPERIKGNVWKIPNSSQSGEHYKHSAQFPEKLATDHILSWCNAGDIVYDPFSGSGTTAISAIKLDRQYIGSEIVKEYFDISEERIKKATKQMRLF